MFDYKAFIGFISLGIILPTLAQDPPQDGGIWDQVSFILCLTTLQLYINDLEQLKTSTELEWADCYNKSQCSRFQVCYKNMHRGCSY